MKLELDMKRYLLILIFFALVLASCTKEESENLSTETEFALFTMKGNKFTSVVKGSAYTEAGVTAKEGDKELEVKISGAVDVNNVGVYDIVYSAVNQDGFPGSVTRTVAVLPGPEQSNVDISGTYNYVATPGTSTITKLAPGLYQTSTVWNPTTPVSAYIITVDGRNWVLPLSSISPYGRVQGTGTLDDSGTLTYVVSLLDQGISNARRIWKK